MKEPHKERLNLVGVLNDAVVTSEIPEGIEVVRDIPQDEFFVEADKEQLCMAFHNIIKNAIEAMIDKETRTIILKINKEDNTRVKISFIDTGVGIAPENMNKLFKPLFTTKARGIGFGLVICKMIIEKHKGSITIESELGSRTVVTLRLPLC